MKALFAICFFFALSSTCSAQANITDSLENRLSQYQKPDSNRLKTLTDLAFYLEDSDPVRGIEYAREAIVLAKKINDQKNEATAYNYLGLNYASCGNDTSALPCFDSCLSIRTKRNDQKGIGSVLHNMGTSYFNLADYDKALKFQKRALEIFNKIGEKTGLGVTYNSLGVIYLFLSDYPKALAQYFDALHIHESENNERGMAGTYINIGLVYDHMGNYEKALEYQFKSFEISKKLDDLTNMQNALGNMGNVYIEMDSPSVAISFFRQAIAINQKLDNNRGLASNYVNTGIAYNGAANYDSATFYLNKALHLYRRLNDKYGMSSTLLYLSNSYAFAPTVVLIQYGIPPKRRFAEAVALQQQGVRLAHEIGNLSTEGDSWQNLSKIYEEESNFALALPAYKKYIAIRDSISNNEKKNAITRLEMQYDFDKKDMAAKAYSDKMQAVAFAEVKRQTLVKNGIAAGAFLLLLSAAIVFIFYKRKHDASQQQKEAELKAEVTQTEMKALRAQMNPHFIFNALSSVGDYVAKNDVAKATFFLTKFAKMMRMILENSEHSEVTLAEDLKALELYMQLEAVRLHDKFTFEIRVDDEIDQHNTLVPPLILQPFVENSIWHGIAKNEGVGKIIVAIRRENEMINCMVEDNGAGVAKTAENTSSKRSLGMKITRSRIEIINKVKKARGSVELYQLAKGTRVVVRLPLALNF